MRGKERDAKGGKRREQEWENMEEEGRKIEGKEERERNRRGGKVGVYKGRMEKEGKWREQPHKTNNRGQIFVPIMQI